MAPEPETQPQFRSQGVTLLAQFFDHPMHIRGDRLAELLAGAQFLQPCTQRDPNPADLPTAMLVHTKISRCNATGRSGSA
jgi:hypothetical protein